MIKAIVTDVDGVLVGKISGVNFPNPHKNVLHALTQIRQSNIPIVLCTGRYYYSMLDIITNAKLQNPHITDGGALLLNPLQEGIIQQHRIVPSLAERIMQLCQKHELYCEVYTAKNYFIQQSQVSPFTSKRTIILQQKPTILPSLMQFPFFDEIIKIIIFSITKERKEEIDILLSEFKNSLSIIWSILPFILPSQNAVITAKGISKKQAVLTVAKLLSVSVEEILGIGDNHSSDWEYMQMCGYIATLANGTKQLKDLVQTKDRYYIGPSVNENGILEVFQHFKLIR